MLRMLLTALTLLTVAGCAPLPPTPQDMQAKRFEPVPGQAVIYIVRTPMDSREMGGLWLDDRVQIATFGGTYYRWEVPPGTHRISTSTVGHDSVTVNAAAGNIYFVEHTVRGTVRSGPQSAFLRRVDEQYGRGAVARSQLL
jgi:hypothetical protein